MNELITSEQIEIHGGIQSSKLKSEENLIEHFDPNETMADLVHRPTPVEVVINEEGSIEFITKGRTRYYDPNNSPFPLTNKGHQCWILGDDLYYPNPKPNQLSD